MVRERAILGYTVIGIDKRVPWRRSRQVGLLEREAALQLAERLRTSHPEWAFELKPVWAPDFATETLS